jgi:hypothetical protein
MPANSGRVGSDVVIRIRTSSTNRPWLCRVIESLARAYPLVEYVAVVVVT